jgi:hypothetical protein
VDHRFQPNVEDVVLRVAKFQQELTAAFVAAGTQGVFSKLSTTLETVAGAQRVVRANGPTQALFSVGEQTARTNTV